MSQLAVELGNIQKSRNNKNGLIVIAFFRDRPPSSPTQQLPLNSELDILLNSLNCQLRFRFQINPIHFAIMAFRTSSAFDPISFTSLFTLPKSHSMLLLGAFRVSSNHKNEEENEANSSLHFPSFSVHNVCFT